MKKVLRVLMSLALVFSVLVSCKSSESVSGYSLLERAGNYIKAMYDSGKGENITKDDYSLVSEVVIDGIKYSVEWTTDAPYGVAISPDSSTGRVTVLIDSRGKESVKYTLTALITGEDGEMTSVSFPCSIPSSDFSSWNEYSLSSDGTLYTIKGIVTAVYCDNNGYGISSFYAEDENGGYYCSSFTSLSGGEGIREGMLVSITGTKYSQDGENSISGASVTILDSSPSHVTAFDLTETIEETSSLVSREARLVVVKDVTAGGEDASDGTYSFEKNGIRSAVRISFALSPMSEEEKNEARKEYESHLGWLADITGILSFRDGVFYLLPISSSSFLYKSLPGKSAGEMIEWEIDNMALKSSFSEDTLLSLPQSGSTYSEVTISWESGSNSLVVDGGRASVNLQKEASSAVLTATLTAGEETRRVSYELSLSPRAEKRYIVSPVSFPEDGGRYKLGLYQNNISRYLYFSGTMSGEKYLSVTDRAEDAPDITPQKTDGGFYFSFTMADGKKYISVVKGRAAITDDAVTVWSIDEETSVPVTLADGLSCYLGCNKTYETIARCSASRILEDTSVIGVSEFPALFVKAEEGTIVLEKASSLSEEKSYILAVSQKREGKDIAFSGDLKSGSLLSSSILNAQIIRIENVDGGFRMYFDKDGRKTYLEISDSAAVLSVSPHSIWRIDEETKIPVTRDGEREYYFASKGRSDCISAVENRDENRADCFPSYLVASESRVVENTPSGDVNPDCVYIMALRNEDASTSRYFSGTFDSEGHLRTSSSILAGVNIYTEETVDGFRMYFIAMGEKTYIDLTEEGKVTLTSMPLATWKMNEKSCTPYATLGGVDYMLGADGRENAIRAYEAASTSEESMIPVILVKKATL